MKKAVLKTIEYSVAENQLKMRKAKEEELLNFIQVRWDKMEMERRFIFLAVVNKKEEAEEKEKKETVVAKRLTGKQVAGLKRETKLALTALDEWPPPPYETITPAPKMSNLNAAELCNTVAPWMVTIPTITAFSACSPTIAANQLLYDALFPLSTWVEK